MYNILRQRIILFTAFHSIRNTVNYTAFLLTVEISYTAPCSSTMYTTCHITQWCAVYNRCM